MEKRRKKERILAWWLLMIVKFFCDNCGDTSDFELIEKSIRNNNVTAICVVCRKKRGTARTKVLTLTFVQLQRYKVYLLAKRLAKEAKRFSNINN